MKKFYTLLAAFGLALAAGAQTTVTFTAGTDNGSNTGNGAADEISKGGVTISCTDAAFAAVNGSTSSGEYRFYKNSTTTITSTAGTITGISFTCTANGTTKQGPGCLESFNTGTYTYTGKVGTWTGSATNITFSCPSNQSRATQIVVALDGASLGGGTATDTTKTDTTATVSEVTLPYSESMAGSFGLFSVEDINLGTLSYVWSTNASYAKASAYVSGAAVAAESYLVSPIINLTGVNGAKLNFDHYANYFSSQANVTAALSVVARAEGETAWTALNVPTWPAGTSWTPVNSGDIDLTAYAGKKMQIAFRYTSTADLAGTWEVKNVSVTAGAAAAVAAPTFSPEGGTYNESVAVILSAGDGSSIYYTTDGTTPDDSSTPYLTPITLTSGATISAIAYDEEGSASEVVQQTYVVNPVSTVTPPYAEDFANGIGSMSTDDYSIWKAGSYNGTYYMKGTSYLNGANTDGQADLKTPKIDLSGVSSATLTFEQSINAYFGTIADEAQVIVVDAEGTEHVQEITYPEAPSKGFSDFLATQVSLDDYAGQVVRIFFRYKGASTAAGTWEVGNVQVVAGTVLAAPTFSPAAGTYSDSVTVTLSADEGSTIYYRLGDSDVVTYTEPFTLTETTTVTAYAVDAELNQSAEATATYTITKSLTGDVHEFDFVANAWGLPTSNGTDGNVGNITGSVEQDGVVLSFSYGESDQNKPRLWQGTSYSDLRFYKNQVLQLQAPEGKQFEQIVFYAYAASNIALSAVEGEDTVALDAATAVAAARGLNKVGNTQSRYQSAYILPTPAPQAAFVATATNRITAIDVVLVDDPTAISAVSDSNQGRDAKAVYDLQGRRVANPAKGLYIVGGKKVLLK